MKKGLVAAEAVSAVKNNIRIPTIAVIILP